VNKAAVEEFQGYSHLTVDGIVGPITWAALGGDAPEPPTLAEGSDGLQTWALPVDAASQVLANLCGVTPPGSG
jgi:peptidoglycan hydrolase-like protein with peptidoglycan-binding domain